MDFRIDFESKLETLVESVVDLQQDLSCVDIKTIPKENSDRILLNLLDVIGRLKVVEKVVLNENVV